MTEYDLRSLKLPVLRGASLKAFAALLDYPFTRGLLLPNLLRQGGVDKLRSLKLSQDPTLYPHDNSNGRGIHQHGETLNFLDLDQYIEKAAPSNPYNRVSDYARAYRQGETTPMEVAQRALEAIDSSDRNDPPLRAFVAVDRQEVLRQARASTDRIESGKPLSIFDGVPTIIKDELNLAPYPTYVGTTFLGGKPEEDNFPVARLRSAGALFLGKGNMNEIGLDPSGFNSHYGTVRNPYNIAHDSGGSSSGPAAAIAAGICPVGLGCDGGGSIRIPSAFCGVVGLKPTFGRVSESCVIPLCPSVDVIGPLGATVEDVALAFAVIAGPDPADPRSLHQPLFDLDGWHDIGLTGLKLGIYTPWFEHASPEVVESCRQMVSRLEDAGAELIEVEIPGLDAMRVAHVVTIVSEQASHIGNYPDRVKELSAPTRVTLALAHAFSAGDYLTAQRVRSVAIDTFESVLAEVDVILTPTTALTAPVIPDDSGRTGWSDLSTTTEKMRYAISANLTGHPAISFPAGYSPSGLPIGMQAIGRYWDEKTLFRVAAAAEAAVERQVPQVYFKLS